MHHHAVSMTKRLGGLLFRAWPTLCLHQEDGIDNFVLGWFDSLSERVRSSPEALSQHQFRLLAHLVDKLSLNCRLLLALADDET